jgi:hypothetical protein
MIKKFNEDWHSHLDKNSSTDSTDSTNDNKGELNVTAGDSFLSAIGKAQKMALQQNRVIKVNFLPDNITLFVDKYIILLYMSINIVILLNYKETL